MEHWEIGQLQKKWDSLIEQYISTLQLTTTQKKRIQNAAEAFFENIRNANQKEIKSRKQQLEELKLQFEDAVKNVNLLRTEVPQLVEKSVGDSIRIEQPTPSPQNEQSLKNNSLDIVVNNNSKQQSPGKKTKAIKENLEKEKQSLSKEHLALYENLKENIEETVQLTKKLESKLPELLRKTKVIEKFQQQQSSNSDLNPLEKAMVETKTTTNKRKRSSTIGTTPTKANVVETPSKKTRKRLVESLK